MPSFCSVVKCAIRAERDQVRFFRIPAELKTRGDVLNTLSKERRELWIKVLKRGDLSETFLKNARICSNHFVSGAPAELKDKLNPDWVPSKNLGYTTINLKNEQAVKRHSRRFERSKRLKREEQEATSISDPNNTNNFEEKIMPEEVACTVVHENSISISIQTEITSEVISSLFDDLAFCNSQIHLLKSKVHNFDLVEESFENNDRKTRYFTGLPNYVMLKIVHKFVAPYLSSKKFLSTFQQLLLTLMKLRLNLPFKYLSYRFSVSATTASETFFATISILCNRFKHFVYWPSREQLQKNIPSCFKRSFGNRVAVIVDCFEVFTETPSKIVNASQCWSNYKHHETVKFLIGITPHGTISYISEAWGGRTSDKFITENCGFLNLILPGDVILADRGFLIEDSVEMLGAQLKIPAFTKGKQQLHPAHIESTLNIATVRIHVERVIGLLKKKFQIFQQTIPSSMLSTADALDEIVMVCSAFINMCNSVVPMNS